MWFNNLFLHFAPTASPILLLIDSHSSLFNPTTVCKATEEKNILFCLSPHTTLIAQLLDISIFGVLKKCWREECQDYMTRNPERVVSKHQYSTLFSASWYRAMTVRNIVAGFKITGVYPFNPKAIVVQGGSDKTPSVTETTGMVYIFSQPRRSQSSICDSLESSISLTSSLTSIPNIAPVFFFCFFFTITFTFTFSMQSP